MYSVKLLLHQNAPFKSKNSKKKFPPPPLVAFSQAFVRPPPYWTATQTKFLATAVNRSILLTQKIISSVPRSMPMQKKHPEINIWRKLASVEHVTCIQSVTLTNCRGCQFASKLDEVSPSPFLPSSSPKPANNTFCANSWKSRLNAPWHMKTFR